MYKTFKHMGKIGDIIYSLPCIRELGGGILYIPENTPDACTGMYSSVKDLLLMQPYIHEVREYPSGLGYGEKAPGIHIDYDLDDARLQPLKGKIHIVKRYMDAFGVNYPGWKEPWLHLERWPLQGRYRNLPKEYVLINYTGRHIKNDNLNIISRVDWARVVRSIDLPVYFIGLKCEHETFEQLFCEIPYLHTNDMYDVALLVRDAQAIYCNQSSILALSQSLGKTYYLEVKPQKTNCLLYTQNENILL
jgi:hypothetical protein